MALKKKKKKNYGEIKRTDGNTMKEEEREERDTGFCELLIKPTRNCWRDVYGFIVPFSRALKRPMQWTFCAVEWRAGGHGGRFVEFLDETQEWIMARCKQSSTRPPNCNFLCLILVTERKKYIYSTNIFFLHSSPFYFFEKVLKRIPSFSSYPFLSFSIFGEIGCFEGSEEIKLSSLEKNFDFSSRSFNCFFAIKIFKLFKLF